MSKRAMAHHVCISRDSADKMIVYSVPPGYRSAAPVKRPKLDGFTDGPVGRAARREVQCTHLARHQGRSGPG